MLNSNTPVFIDGHVHIYACHAIERVFDAAWRHFQKAASHYGAAEDFQGVLILTESAGNHVFCALTAATGETVGHWHVTATAEANSLRLHRHNGAQLLVLAGRQLVSTEKLKLSAYFVTETLADGVPLVTLVEQVHRLGGVSVLPWGVGKWFGKRGQEIAKRLRHSSVPLMVSDNGGRPWFWPGPRLFRLARQQGIAVLAGSDPLPKVSEQQRAGGVGFMLRGALRPEYPAQDLKRQLCALEDALPRYGKPEGTWRFFRNQFYMQYRRFR